MPVNSPYSTLDYERANVEKMFNVISNMLVIRRIQQEVKPELSQKEILTVSDTKVSDQTKKIFCDAFYQHVRYKLGRAQFGDLIVYNFSHPEVSPNAAEILSHLPRLDFDQQYIFSDDVCIKLLYHSIISDNGRLSHHVLPSYSKAITNALKRQ